MWTILWPGTEPMPPALECGVLTTGPPGQSQIYLLWTDYHHLSRGHSPSFLSPCVSLFSGLIISNWSSPLTKPAVSCLYDTELMRGLGLDRGRRRKQLTGIFQGRACNHEWNHWCDHITWKLCFHYTIPLPGGPGRPQDACRCQHSPCQAFKGFCSLTPSFLCPASMHSSPDQCTF